MISWIQWLLIGVLIGLLLVNFVVAPSAILRRDGSIGSMEPTVQIGDVFLIEKFSWKLGLRSLQPGDIIAFNHPRKLYKRLIAMGGQRVQIAYCYVFIDGHPLTSNKFNCPNHPDPQRRCYHNMGQMQAGVELLVPAGYYFVLGDNSALNFDSKLQNWVTSMDSRFAEVGFVKHENVYGRIFLRIWPPWRWGVP